MGTYYRYVDRDVEQNVNWFDIGESISKPFFERRAEIAKQKEAVNKESNELVKKLENPELGNNRDVNSLMIDAGAKLSETQKSLNQLFADNLISYKEYLQASQNTKSSAEKISQFPKVFNEASQKTAKGILDGTLSTASSDILGIVGGSANANTAGFVVDGTGRLYMGTKVQKTVNGQQITSIDTDPTKLSDVQNNLSMAQNAPIPMYDVKAFTDSVVDKAQKFITVMENTRATVGDKGYFVTMDDLTKNKDWTDALDLASDAVVTNPKSLVSLLKDKMSVIDVVTGKDAKGNDIVEKKDIIVVSGKPKAPNEIGASVDANGAIALEFTDEQKKAAKDFLTTQAKSKVNVIIDQKDISQNRNDAIDLAELNFKKRQYQDKKEEENNIGVYLGSTTGQLFKGTVDEKKRAVANFRARGVDIDIDPKGNIVYQNQIVTGRGGNTKNLLSGIATAAGYSGDMKFLYKGFEEGSKAQSSYVPVKDVPVKDVSKFNKNK